MSKNLHADFRDTFIFVVNSRWKKIEEEKNALDAMKQSLEKEGGKINRVLLVWLFLIPENVNKFVDSLAAVFTVVTHDAPPPQTTTSYEASIDYTKVSS